MTTPLPRTDRRTLLKAGAAMAAPLFVHSSLGPARAWGADGAAPASERIRMAAIGTGGKGRHNVGALLACGDVDFVGVADVDAAHRDQAAAEIQTKTGKAPEVVTGDYRQLLDRNDVDAVVISTPDHWHALASVHAAQAGKDIYCEKPLANSIGEGRAICEAVAKHQRILQTGSHERSNPNVRRACELVRSGALGTVREVRINMPTEQEHHQRVANYGTAPAPTEPPAGLDYDMWQGPAATVPYIADRVHFWWRFVLAYGGGEMTDRGAHIIDIAQLALDRDATGPTKIYAVGNRPQNGLYDAFMDYVFINEYADGLKMIGVDEGPRGVRFIGDKGSLFVHVHGGQLEAEPESVLALPGSVEEGPLGRTENHHRNFLDAVKSREQPFAPPEAGHRTATICHLNNIAMRLGRPLQWDPKSERFENDDEANALVMPEMRKPYQFG
ncbi:Gfo/Idh/MocA family protein [Candidatus Laterigemmans baculatus]|uniref:Gfo/Idh/MocA family protein n=1 Tax=Candidatus Laterigemmans baculatus TaxID=2770505 RepID=UPI0013D8F1AA|nr:Gfo/Idh/MocA family oxidoreductase [Candidatus Laterigemmans baculatus]